ncbi:MAG: hypothetical protein HUJ52_04450, partial [Malacoplasma sp.]|nr:hypothetical protein [Malacoplasma sp.]
MEKVLENLVKNEIKNFNENKYKNNFYDDTDLGKINVKVFGIGGAGCNVIECMAKSYNWNNAVSLYALDTDVRTLRRICESGLNANCHLLGKDICRGNGTGGDVELAKQVASNDIEQFKKFIHGSDLIFFISGLGKGTGSAITPVFSSIAKEAGICTVDVITLPSVQAEGHDVYEKSLASYQEIIDSCNSFYTISNDKLINAYIEDEKMTYENLLNKANMQVINLIKVISDILSNPLYTTIAASDILAFFRKTKSRRNS